MYVGCMLIRPKPLCQNKLRPVDQCSQMVCREKFVVAERFPNRH